MRRTGMDFGVATIAGRGALAGIAEAYRTSNAGRPAACTLRYPVELIDVLALRDGQRVTIRPILPLKALLDRYAR
jgi:hypothetical protein